MIATKDIEKHFNTIAMNYQQLLDKIHNDYKESVVIYEALITRNTQLRRRNSELSKEIKELKKQIKELKSKS